MRPTHLVSRPLTIEEQKAVDQGNLDQFWQSRTDRGDPGGHMFNHGQLIHVAYQVGVVFMCSLSDVSAYGTDLGLC
ncbi:MAG: hypothetical protein COA91_13325 [Robiginitomaculum sp.]|nr:MAG: hypothetical protein COA91_13325 [Robiginitomaculum sp.]